MQSVLIGFAERPYLFVHYMQCVLLCCDIYAKCPYYPVLYMQSVLIVVLYMQSVLIIYCFICKARRSRRLLLTLCACSAIASTHRVFVVGLGPSATWEQIEQHDQVSTHTGAVSTVHMW